MNTVRLYVSFGADLLSVVLLIGLLISMRKLPVEKNRLKRYFRNFAGLVLLMAVIHLLKSYADLRLESYMIENFGTLSSVDDPVWLWTEMAAAFCDIFLSTVFLNMWISFLSWFLFDDRDFIRRKFWFGFTPLIISAVVSAVSIPMAVMSKMGFIIFVIAVCIFFIIRIFYFLLALWLLNEYKKQNGYLRFFNPYVFFVPVFAGWLIEDIVSWGFSALGTTIGIICLYITIIEELRYRDPDTGFYKMNFTGYLRDLIQKGRYDPCSAMIFTLDSPGEMAGFSGILKDLLPKECEPIIHSDREVVVLTSVREKGPLVMVMEDVKAVSEVKTDCTLKKKTETAEEFMERVL